MFCLQLMFFLKACALGNDFVIFPDYPKDLDLSDLAKQASNRRYGIGCDQVIFVDKHKLRFFNADGSEAQACGNGTRAVALWKMIAEEKDHITLSTHHEDLYCEKISFVSARVFFKRKAVILPQQEGISVHIGNPHFVYFVKEFSEDIQESNRHFYEKYHCNIEATKIIDETNIAIRIFERGVGPTPSCGTGACAAALASFHQKLTAHKVAVHQEGGMLMIEIEKDQFSIEGPVVFSFSGIFKPDEKIIDTL